MISVTFCETFVIIHNELSASCALLSKCCTLRELVAQMDVKPRADSTVMQKQAFADTTMVPAYIHTHTLSRWLGDSVSLLSQCSPVIGLLFYPRHIKREVNATAIVYQNQISGNSILPNAAPVRVCTQRRCARLFFLFLFPLCKMRLLLLCNKRWQLLYELRPGMKKDPGRERRKGRKKAKE